MKYASVLEHIVTVEKNTTTYRRKCRCGCSGKATHKIFANGISMGEGCEFSMYKFARDCRKARESQFLG